jgi:tetraacyldisaccharide 4'-kinase
VNPLSAVYGAVVDARNSLYDRGTFKQHRLAHPVISVGSISAGGAGKTPFTILLGRLLQQKQVAFDVLSRGYGRNDSKIRLVDAKGNASLYGDEPLLLARELEVPVIVGADRVAAGRHAERLFADTRSAHGQWIHLLDDGFQHRRLARDFDVVLFSRKDLEDTLLPMGRLREPHASLRRADAITITDDLSDKELPAEARGKHIWRVRRQLQLASAAPQRVIAFCGVARPQNFFTDLNALGVTPVGTMTFPDHHSYISSDSNALLRMKEQAQATAFVTTTKDLINLESTGLLATLEPVTELKLSMQFVSPDPDSIFRAIAERTQR